MSASDKVVQSFELEIVDYASLRAYSGTLNWIDVTAQGIAGSFVVDAADITSPDNSGTIIVATDGRRWKRVYTGPANVKWFGATGDGINDDTAAFNAALLANPDVFAPAATYICLNVSLQDGSHLYGDGWSTVIKQKSTAIDGDFLLAANKNDGGTPSVLDNKKNIVISNLQLAGPLATPVLLEHCHLLFLSAVSDVLVENVKFFAFRGDGLYVGSGDSGTAERHNERLVVRNCRFDGVNNENRNGISVLDIDGIVIENCSFEKITKSTMPGAIDFEPNAHAYSIIKNITINNICGSNVGGNVGCIGFIISNVITTTPINILINDIKVKNYVGTGAIVTFLTYRSPTDTSVENNLIISNLCASAGAMSLNIQDGKRVKVENCTFSDFTGPFLLGGTYSVRDIEISSSRLIRCGSSRGNGMIINAANYISIKGNKFIDCGTGVGGASNALDFNSGISTNITLNDNEFSAPTGKTLYAIVKEVAHTLTPSTNRFMGNTLNGLGQFFEAEESDVIVSHYSPIVGGASTVGVGTYTEQTGLYYRIGKRVFFKIRVAVAAGHTGTGLVQVSLPLTAATMSYGDVLTICAAGVVGLAVSGGVTCRLNASASLNGIFGTLRIYFSGNTGIAAFNQAVIPANAFEIECAGEYTTT